MSETNESTTAALRRLETEVAAIRSQIDVLRRGLLRAGAVVAVVLLFIGLVLPMATGSQDGKPVTVRVLTAGFQALGEPGDGEGKALGIVFGIGFLGLLITVLMVIGILLFSVIGGADQTRHAWIGNTLGVLACIGAVVALLYSVLGWLSQQAGVAGGWGPLVLLVGVVMALMIIKRLSWLAR